MEDDDKKKAKVIVAMEFGVESMEVVSVLTMVYTLSQLFLLLAIPTALQKFIAESLGKGDENAVKISTIVIF